MTCKCQEIPIGPSRAEAIRGAVEVNNARWVTAMEETIADIRRRAESCMEMTDKVAEDHDAARLFGKAIAYGHAAEMLHDAIARAKGTP